MSTPLVLLVGNPNSGKTTLFNALTGLSARVGNYPGITVEHREGTATFGATKARVLDVPGTYSLLPRSDDEAVAVRAMLAQLPDTQAADVVVVVVDATQLERNLHLVAQLRELPLPLVVALSMTDTIARDGHSVDVALLSSRIGVPVVAAPAVRGGADALRAQIAAMLDRPVQRLALNVALSSDELGESTSTIDDAGRVVCEIPGMPQAPRTLGLLVAQAQAVDGVAQLPLPADVRARLPTIASASRIAASIVQARWRRVEAWVVGVVGVGGVAGGVDVGPARSEGMHKASSEASSEAPSARRTRRLDAVALHPVLGPVVFVTIFFTMFQALFSWAAPVMDAIGGGVEAIGAFVGGHIPASMPLLRSLIVDGVVAGVGNVVVFVPQIAILFLLLSILEDSGYLARAAFLLDRLMAGVGLHGRAFVPMLSGFACAVPAILATRTIESTKDRIVTILVTPLISCSARLPVYALVIATVFSTIPPVWGVVPVGVVVMVSMYTLSLTAAIAMAAVFKRTLLKSASPPLVLELPPYRLPHASQLWRAVWTRVRTFLVEAGTVILAITVVLWALFTFPRDDTVLARRDAALAVIDADASASPDVRLQRRVVVEDEAARDLVARSLAGRAGHALEPVIAPLGFDWKLGVGLVASFAAREVLVSTLGLVYGLGRGADEESTSLQDAMRADVRADGTPVYTPLVGLSLLVFFVLAMQCMSTLAAVRRETGGWRWPAIQLAYMSALAWGASFIVYQGGLLLGLGGGR